MFWRTSGTDEGMGPGELEVAPRCGRVECPERVLGKHLQRRTRIRRIAINPDRGGCLPEQVLDDPDVGFPMDVVEDQRQVAPRWKLGITQHVPECGPHERACQRVRELGKVPGRRGQ